MSLPIVLHPDVVDFLRQDVETHFRERVWKCLKKLKMRQFDSGLRVKKLNGITKRVWEARVNQGCRLIFSYEKSQQPETRKLQAYIAVQDICLDHDDVSRRARARNETPDAQWLDAEVIETIGSLERDRYTLDDREKAALETEEAEDLSHNETRADELLGNIPWRVLESEEQWQQAIVSADADLPLKLTPQEFELVKLSGNLLLSGSAGTGKTTVAVYRLLQNLSDSLSGKRLYVAYNPLLVSNAQEQFKRLIGKQRAETEAFFQFKTIRNLCLEIVQASGEPYWCQDEVDFQVFDELYRGHPKRQSFPSTLIWDEIRSIIKGSQLSPHVKAISKKDYENLAKKRSTVIDKNQRYEVYKLAEWYDKKLKSDGKFDEIDLARNVLQIVKKDETIRYQLIVCDEVQDLTELQLELLFQLLAPDGNILFAGDLHQMISPSGFRWEELKQKFYRSQREVAQKTLNFNFRSVGTLVNLANQLLSLRSRLLSIPVDGTSMPAASYGQLARLINSTTESLRVNLTGQLNPGDAILVRTDADKEKLRKEFQSSFVFTVEEAKGLEFDTVFLVEFFKPARELWSKVLRGGSLKDKEKPHLQLELNLLYVAITRPRRILNIWESSPSSVWNQPELTGCLQLLLPESVSSDRIEATPERWREQGFYYLKAEFREQAIECFEKSGDIQLQQEVNAELLVQRREYGKAAEILKQLQEWQEAAQLFERVKEWQKASACWARAGESQKQEICEAYVLESARQWEEAAQKWETLGRDEDALRCRMNIPEKKAEYLAIELEQKKQWLKAALEYERAGLLEKAAKCRAKEFEKKMQWKQAAQQYELAGLPEKAQECRQYLNDTALEKSKKGDYKTASKTFDNTFELNSKEGIIYYNQGITCLQSGDNKGAFDNFNKALELNPNYAKAYYRRGMARGDLPMFDTQGSLDDLNKALELNPKMFQAYAARGVAHLNMGNYADAINDESQALKFNPNIAEAYRIRGDAHRRLGNTDATLSDYKKAAKLFWEQGDDKSYQYVCIELNVLDPDGGWL